MYNVCGKRRTTNGLYVHYTFIICKALKEHLIQSRVQMEGYSVAYFHSNPLHQCLRSDEPPLRVWLIRAFQIREHGEVRMSSALKGSSKTQHFEHGDADEIEIRDVRFLNRTAITLYWRSCYLTITSNDWVGRSTRDGRINFQQGCQGCNGSGCDATAVWL